MMKTAASKEIAALRSRHKRFFSRLDVFLRNYAQGVCGNDPCGSSALSDNCAAERQGKLRS